MEIQLRRLYCRHCNIWVEMQAAAAQFHSYEHPAGDISTSFETYLCPSCGKPTLIEVASETYGPAFGMEAECHIELTTLYPELPDVLAYLPDKVSVEYKSALEVKGRNNNAFAVSCGRVIEQTCDELQARGGNLYEKLENLKRRDLLPGSLVEAANGIRLLRNLGAHASLGNVSDSEAAVLYALVNGVLEYVFKGPALVSQLRALLNDTHL
jgi:hypothetical protein